jgi:predicted nucleic acid-binding protein
MILVDTSVWVDHFRQGDDRLDDLLRQSMVCVHPFVVGEMACGHLRNRQIILELLQSLPSALQLKPEQVLDFIERSKLMGKGIGYVDAHLCASASCTETKLWTRDKRLLIVLNELGLAWIEPVH